MAIYKWFPVRVTGVTLDKSALIMLSAGDTQQLTATVSPANAEDKSVVWSTSDATIATVDQTGLVTCVTPGNCDIIVTTVDGGHTAVCGVTNSGWAPSIHTLLYCPLDNINGTDDITNNHTIVSYTYNGNTPAIDSTGFYYFNGGFLQTSDSYTGPAQGTISAWFKKEDKGTPSIEWALSTHRGSYDPYHIFAMDLGNNDTRPIVVTSNNVVISTYPGNQPMDEWFQWTLTYSSTSGMKLYINGTLVSTESPNGTLKTDYNEPTCIGGSIASYAQYFKGYIGDVIYEDVVWNSGQVGVWYNQSKEKYGWQPSSNTICYYPFDNDALDETGNTTLTVSGTITKDTIGYDVTGGALVGAAQLGSTPAFVGGWFYFNSLSQPYCDVMDVNGIGYYVNHLAGHLDKIFYIWNNGTAYHSNSTGIGTGSWHHLCYSVGATNKFYVDGQLFWSDSTQSTTSGTDLTLFNGWGGSTDSSATLSRFIVESVAWTDQEVEDYYNLTKWRYGL